MVGIRRRNPFIVESSHGSIYPLYCTWRSRHRIPLMQPRRCFKTCNKPCEPVSIPLIASKSLGKSRTLETTSQFPARDTTSFPKQCTPPVRQKSHKMDPRSCDEPAASCNAMDNLMRNAQSSEQLLQLWVRGQRPKLFLSWFAVLSSPVTSIMTTAARMLFC
jgi:hypothetical protein